MQGLMMDMPLLISSILQHAARHAQITGAQRAVVCNPKHACAQDRPHGVGVYTRQNPSAASIFFEVKSACAVVGQNRRNLVILSIHTS
jgi:hypothetical protein